MRRRGGGAGTRAGYASRLRLTWTNQAPRLLAHEVGACERVPPSSDGGTEVRLLHDITAARGASRDRLTGHDEGAGKSP